MTETTKNKNSWKNLSAPDNTAKSKFKYMRSKLSKHKSVGVFCGVLTPRQQIAFAFCLTLWAGFNLYSLISMMRDILNKDTNKKIVSSEVLVQDLCLPNDIACLYPNGKPLPRIGFMACAASVTTLYDAYGWVGNISLGVREGVTGTPEPSFEASKCKTYTSESKFNDYRADVPVHCCATEIPKDIYTLPENLKR